MSPLKYQGFKIGNISVKSFTLGHRFQVTVFNSIGHLLSLSKVFISSYKKSMYLPCLSPKSVISIGGGDNVYESKFYPAKGCPSVN